MVMRCALIGLPPLLFLLSCADGGKGRDEPGNDKGSSGDLHYPTFHYSSARGRLHGMDGLVRIDGAYHLFYRYENPSSEGSPYLTGHALSSDLFDWRELPIRFGADTLRLCGAMSFSWDSKNRTRLAPESSGALLAYFAYAGEEDIIQLGLAYSLDRGENWFPYSGNPLMKFGREGEWYAPRVNRDSGENWILTLSSGKDGSVRLFDSTDGLEWSVAGDFDLRSIVPEGELNRVEWIPSSSSEVGDSWLLVELNSGGPNGGSGTLLIPGLFDGSDFEPDATRLDWLDYGPDFREAVFAKNAGTESQLSLLGALSNKLYGEKIPGDYSSLTSSLPRSLSLQGGKPRIRPQLPSRLKPVWQHDSLGSGAEVWYRRDSIVPGLITFRSTSRDFRVSLRNGMEEELSLYVDAQSRSLLVDRIFSGRTAFEPEFANKKHYVPLDELPDEEFELRLWLDRTSLEIFLGEGSVAASVLAFPNTVYDQLVISNSPIAGEGEIRDIRLLLPADRTAQHTRN